MPAPLTLSQLVQPHAHVHDYEEATDGCRLVRATSDNARQWQRVKPDKELYPLAEFDCKKESTHAWAAAAAYSS